MRVPASFTTDGASELPDAIDLPPDGDDLQFGNPATSGAASPVVTPVGRWRPKNPLVS